jgi:hypothetical protein
MVLQRLANRLRAPLLASTTAPAGGKQLCSLSGPGSSPTATEATRYGGRLRVKLVQERRGLWWVELGGADGNECQSLVVVLHGV